VGTSVGAFRATNSCVSAAFRLNPHLPCWSTIWQPWGEGLPVQPSSTQVAASGAMGTTVNALDGQIRADGRFYVYAATWERGIWVRDVSGDDP
jgi:hypothetical protein